MSAEHLTIPLAPALLALRAVMRALAIVYLLPWTGSRAVPHHVRVALAVFIGPLAWLPSLQGAPALPATPEDYLLQLGGDLLLGAALAMTLRLVLAGIAAAGSIAAFQVGLTLSAVLDPDSGARREPIARLHEWLALAIGLATGLHRQVLAAVADVFRLDVRLCVDSLARVADSAGLVLSLGLRLAAPVVACLLATDVVLAIAGRLVPQVQASAIAHPARLLVALVVLALALPMTAQLVARHLAEVPASWPRLVTVR